MEIETDDPIETKWMAFDGSLWDRESDAIERVMNATPVRVYFCPECGGFQYTEDAAKECCDF